MEVKLPLTTDTEVRRLWVEMMTRQLGFSVRIFVPSGEPDELRIVEKSNWTGQGFVFPRSLFSEVRKRPELKRTGVYIVWGPGESGQLPKVYIGEGDLVLARMDDHARRRDFWTHAIVFTSKDQNLNKAHIQHLESRLIRLAMDAKRSELDNNNVPQSPPLSEADVADAEAFLADMLLCLPVVGVSLFEKARVTEQAGKTLYLRVKEIEAKGVDGAEGFIVLAGSLAAKAESRSIHAYLSTLRRALLAKGVLTDAGPTFRVTQDYTFNSPSTASGALLGRTSNGRIEWKDCNGITLRDIQEADTS